LIKDYIACFRPSHAAGFVVISVFALLGMKFLFGVQLGLSDFLELVALCYLFSLYGFINNNHFDRFADRKNPTKLKHNPIAAGRISPMQSVLLNFMLAAVAVALSSLWFLRALPIVLFAIANVTLYNAFFKSKPLLDLISHALWTASFVLIPMIALGLPAGLLLPVILLVLAESNLLELRNQMSDRSADKSADVTTTAVRYGMRFARALFFLSAAVFVLGVLFFYFYFSRWYILLFLAFPAVDIAVFLRPALTKYNNTAMAIMVLLLMLAFLFGGMPFL